MIQIVTEAHKLAVREAYPALFTEESLQADEEGPELHDQCDLALVCGKKLAKQSPIHAVKMLKLLTGRRRVEKFAVWGDYESECQNLICDIMIESPDPFVEELVTQQNLSKEMALIKHHESVLQELFRALPMANSKIQPDIMSNINLFVKKLCQDTDIFEKEPEIVFFPLDEEDMDCLYPPLREIDWPLTFVPFFSNLGAILQKNLEEKESKEQNKSEKSDESDELEVSAEPQGSVELKESAEPAESREPHELNARLKEVQRKLREQAEASAAARAAEIATATATATTTATATATSTVSASSAVSVVDATPTESVSTKTLGFH